MKTTSWNRRQFRQLAGAGALLLTGCLAGVASANAQQTNAPAKPAETSSDADSEDLVNWVDVGVGGSVVSGDKAQYQKQSGLPANTAFGGINAFHFEEPVAKKGLFSVDGRGIFDNHDYDLKLEVEHPDVGYVRAGFRQYRQYYDATGGYLPNLHLFFPPANKELSMDRGTAFIEGALTLPDWPVLKIRYEHDYRNGAEDSTEWGQTTLTPGAVQRKIAPAFRLLDEKTDILSADGTYTVKNTDLGLGIRYEWDRNNDSQNILFQPNQGANTRTLTQSENDKSDIFNIHGFSDTTLNPKLEFTTGYSYTLLHSEMLGSRTDNPAVPATTDTRYVNLNGGSAMEQYETDLNLMYTPTENFYIVPAVRFEREVLNGGDTDNALTTVAGHNVVGALTDNNDSSAAVNCAQSLDARYLGVTNWVFYVRGEWEENEANLKEFSGLNTVTPVAREILDDVWHQFSQKYSIGANWYPLRGLNFSGQYYYKLDDNRYDNTIPTVNAASGYPGFIQQENFQIHDVNFRATWRPLPQLSLVSRYDYQYTTVDMRGGVLASVQSGNTETHMFGESISWTPLNRLYVEAGANYVFDHTHTPAEQALAPNVILESRNDYWTADATIGYALNDKTNLRTTYTYYRSADYVDNSAVGLPLGAGGEQHTVTAALQRQITKKMTWGLSYTFACYRDQLFGGNLDYSAHTILSSIQYRF